MDLQHHLDDLERRLRHEALREALPSEHDGPPSLERLLDPEAVRALSAWAESATPPHHGAERLAGHVIERLARSVSQRESAAAAVRVGDVFRGGAAADVEYESVWPRLAATAAADDRRRWVEPLEAAAAASEEGLADVAAARGSALERLGLPDALRRWECAAGRSLSTVRALAEEVLATTAAPYEAGLRSLVRREAALPPSAWHWVDLPWCMAGRETGAELPPIDDQLLAFVAADAGLVRPIEKRVDIGVRGSAPTRSRVVVVEPGRRVRVDFVRLGPLADFGNMLRCCGAALAGALGPTGPPGPAGAAAPASLARFPDPAVTAAWESLFESLASSPAWLERLLNRPAPPALSEATATVGLASLRAMAVGVVAARDNEGERLALAQDVGETATEATGFRHPTGVLPGAISALRGADEVVGQVGAAMLEEHLATLHGRLWCRRAPAIRLLREIWHDAALVPLEILIRELGLGRLDVAPLQQRARERLASS